MKCRRRSAWTAAVFTCWWFVSLPLQSAPPRLLEPGYRLEMIAEAPQIVTPVALTFGSDGQLYVIESHTHHRPEGYEGPDHDRIWRLRDTDGDGKPDEWTPFLNETDQTMSVLAGSDQWLYVATRREILRVRDTNGDGKADQRQTLITLETDGDYPHNGLAGLIWTPEGQLGFGLGENLGATYRVVAADGTDQAGGGEGGSFYLCQPDGSHVTRLATGFWNPFGSGYDPLGRLFVVDNDPDASPPCRLLHVVPTADYGYQFRYGRSGRHPLQAWDGELTGTLPMAAGTGEAPCQVVAYHGRLWVTSWGDHRIEAFSLSSHGATVKGQLSVVVQGEADFRPVGLAIAPDKSLVFSDWVDRSYPVHRQGRLWRLVPEDEQAAKTHAFPPLSPEERRAAELRRSPQLSALNDADPYIRQAAIAGLAEQMEKDAAPEYANTLSSPQQRLGWLQAFHWNHPSRANQWVSQSLADPAAEPSLFALRVVAGERLSEFTSQVAAMLSHEDMTVNEADGQALSASDELRRTRLALATLAWLEQGSATRDTDPFEDRLLGILRDFSRSPRLRAFALRMLPADHEGLDSNLLKQTLRAPAPLPTETVGVLQLRDEPWAAELLAQAALDNDLTETVRADAIAALASHRESQLATLKKLSQEAGSILQIEAQRSLGGAKEDEGRPDIHDMDAWMELVDKHPGDAARGRRVFFRANGPRCSVCHQHEGRGGNIGPDLSTISQRKDRRWLLQAILDPNRDVGPRYASVQWITERGTTFTGLPLSGPGEEGRESLVAVDGSIQTLPSDEIAQRFTLSTSIMPSGLDGALSVAELRDLLAFLMPQEE